MKSSCSRQFLGRSIFFLCYVFIIAFLVGFAVTPVNAEVFIVTTTSDDVPGSLRAAIASADSYDDVISFDVTGTITLSSQLEIYTGMKIQGPGADLLAVSGGGECRVFYIDNTAESVDISGISIVSGEAFYESAGSHNGGGIYNQSDNLTVDGCHFSVNHADSGGGMCNCNGSPIVINCAFYANSSDQGGGMFNSASRPIVTNCTFFENSVNRYGGGMCNYSSSPSVTNCTFSGNNANDEGGAMYNDESTPTVTNCTFSGNNANDEGGGMYNTNLSSPIVTNCIFWDGGNEISNYSSDPILSYCVVQSNDYGGSTISGYLTSADPVLQDLADNGGPTWTCALGAGSLAIDAGTDIIVIDEGNIEAPETDQRGVLRPWGSHLDIGAYEVDVESFNIIPYWTSGGIITPASTTVFEGESVDFTISPDISYHIENIYIDGEPISFEPVNDIYTHTFSNVSVDHGLFAVFEPSDDNDDDNIADDDDDGGGDNTGGDGGGGCNISALSSIGLLLLVPMMFLSGKIK